MNSQQQAVIAGLHKLLSDARDNHGAYSLAARFCPEPWAGSLRSVAESFLFHQLALEGIHSQLEALFNEGGENIAQDVECP